MKDLDQEGRKRRLLVGGGLVAIGGAIAVFVLRGPSDEEQIRDQLAKISETVRIKEGPPNPVFYVARLNDGFKDELTTDVRIHFAELGMSHTGRAELARAGITLVQRYGGGDVTFRDIEIKMDDAHASAQVSVQAEVVGQRYDGSQRREERPATFLFKKLDGQWLVASVTVWGPSRSP